MWGEKLPYSTQLGHFLTAVDMGFDGSDVFKRGIIGHEQISDTAPLAAARAFVTIPSDADVTAFDWAIVDDMQGNTNARDAKLASIFDPGKHGPQADRKGNSMEDLRLSVRGWELGRLVALGEIKTNVELANWIGLNVAGY